MNDYEAKQERKRERLEEAAGRAESRSQDRMQASHRATAGIPFGQPILVGHHSERRHRNALKRSDQAMRRSIEEDDRASELRHRAEAVGKGGISSDDPDAIDKLREKLATLELQSNTAKRINAEYRKNRRTMDKGAALNAVSGLSNDEKLTLARGMAAAFWIDQPMPFGSNRSAQIRSVRQRIAELEARLPADAPTRELARGEGWVAEERPELNRTVFDFDAKPSADVRKLLKERGFKWMRSEGVWSRSLSGGSRYAVEVIAEKIPAAWRS